jgi:hypothetical protein
MAYFGEAPWHKLGTKLENPATAAEAIEAAGLNYQVELVPLANRFYEDLQPKIDLLANHFPTQDQLHQFFSTLYPDPADGNSTRAENVRAELFRLFDEGIGQDIPGIRHSAWAALHAVTEYVDHRRTTRGRSELDRTSKRLQSLWFGSGARLKQQAWDLALAMAT